MQVLTKPFNKRKTADRSPEVPQPSKKSSFRTLSPTISAINIPPSESGAPPLTMTPSFVSIDSFGSETHRNFEADHLRLLLNASKEDLRLERNRAAEREQQQADMLQNQRLFYEARIRELQSDRGEGPSRRR